MISISVSGEMKENVAKVIKYSQKMPKVNVDDVLTAWSNNKYCIYKFIFDEKLIVEKDISIELNEEIKNKRFLNFIEDISADICSFRFQDDFYLSLIDFLTKNKAGFYDNKTVEDFYIPESGVKIEKNCKLIKCFKYFIFKPELLHKWQSLASMIIQDKVLEGQLCVSIHPLDYLSCSENNYNWRSCYALDGEYRAGTLSFMTDKTSVICYFKKKDNQKLPHFPEDVPWNDKQWRMTIFLANQNRMAFAGKQYPYANPTLQNEALKLISESFSKFDNAPLVLPYGQGKIHKIDSRPFSHVRHQPIYIGGSSKNSFSTIVDLLVDDGNLHYNDVKRNHNYTPEWAYNSKNFADIPATFNPIGNKFIRCTCCGNSLIEDSESMMCRECTWEYGDVEDVDYLCRCPICHNIEREDDMTYVESFEDHVCSCCLSDSFSYCEHCGEMILTDRLCYDEKTDENLCEWCYSERVEGR